MTTPQKKKSYDQLQAGKEKDKEKFLRKEKKRQEKEVLDDNNDSTE